jgi:RNA polymerase sigma factor for flagellar operon FliA
MNATTALADDYANAEGRSSQDNSLILAFGVLKHKEVLPQLIQRITELPQVPKKVLAMYYYENLHLSEISACFGLTESQIDDIRTQTVGLLHSYVLNVWTECGRA